MVDVDRHVIGIVSEADLLLRQQHPADSFQRFLLEGRRRRLQRAKAMGGTAAELMSRPAITTGRDATVAEAARLLRMHLIKRLPVVDPTARLSGPGRHGRTARRGGDPAEGPATKGPDGP